MEYKFNWGIVNDICNEILKNYKFYEERDLGEPRRRLLKIDFLYNIADYQYEKFYKELHERLKEYNLANPKGWEFIPCEEETRKLKKAISHLLKIEPEYSSSKELEYFYFYDIDLNLKATA